MLKMRLQRVGRRHDPSYRIIVTESSRGPKAGRYVDLIGNYAVKHGNVKIDGEKAKLWVGRGAQVSGTVWNLLISEGIIEGKKVNVLPKKTVPQKEEAVEAQEETTPESSEGTDTDEKKEPEESSEVVSESEENKPTAKAEETSTGESSEEQKQGA